MRMDTVNLKRVLLSHWWLIVAASSLTTLALALIIGMHQSIWFDEGYSIMLAQRPVSELIALTQVDAHPPLYYLYLKAWGSVFGWSELALRLSSAIPSALAVAGVALVARRLFSPGAALAALPFIVLMPLFVRYSFEIRMYAVVALLAVFGTYALIRARQSGRAVWWLGYVAVVIIGIYTLYMTVLVWIAHAVWLVMADRIEGKSPFKQKHWLYVPLIIIALIPWLPSLSYQIAHSALPSNVSGADGFAIVNILSLVTAYTPTWWASGLLLGIVVISFSLLIWLLVVLLKRVQRSERTNILLPFIGFILVGAGYIFLAVVTSKIALTERYLISIIFFLPLCISAVLVYGFRHGERFRAGLLGLLMIGLFGYGLSALAHTGNYNFQRLQPVYADTVREAIDCKDTTLVTSGAYGYIDMWYAFQGCDFRYYQPADLVYTGGYAPLNALNTTKRVADSRVLTNQRVAFIYYDDSTEFLTIDDRYVLEKRLDYIGLHVEIYRYNDL